MSGKGFSAGALLRTLPSLFFFVSFFLWLSSFYLSHVSKSECDSSFCCLVNIGRALAAAKMRERRSCKRNRFSVRSQQASPARIELDDSFCPFVESLFRIEIQVRQETRPFVLLHVDMLTTGPCASSGHSQSPLIDMSTSLLLVLQGRFSSLVLQV